MKKPTSEEIKKFVEVFDKLCQFEAEQRVIQNKGCYLDDDYPIKVVGKVKSWLKSRATVKDKDAINQVIDKFENKVDELRIESASAHAKNDYITYSTLNEEVLIYEDVVDELKNIGGLYNLKRR
ncbi:hypothetical protein N9948_00385 [bacterium]|nr:hypothetical protein [bacterium]